MNTYLIFQGPFKKRAGPDSIWKTVREDVDHSHFECDKSADNDYRIPTSREYQLMDRAVPSSLNRPIYKVRLIFLQLSTAHHLERLE